MMKDNTVYNHATNMVMVKSEGDMIFVICSNEDQMENVVKRMTVDNCSLQDYEVWDEGEDTKFIMSFKVLDDYDKKPELN